MRRLMESQGSVYVFVSRRAPGAAASCITIALIAANVLVWLFVQGAGAPQPLVKSICDLGLILGELTGAVPGGPSFPSSEGYPCVTEAGRHAFHLFVPMFLQGSLVHIPFPA